MAKNFYGNGYVPNMYSYNMPGYSYPYGQQYLNYNQYPQQTPQQIQQQMPQTNQFNSPTQVQTDNSVSYTSPTSLAYVNGIEGAKAYILPPNSCILLMDSDNPMFYIKTSNMQGQCTLRYFTIKEEDMNAVKTSSASSQTVSREEFESLKAKLDELQKSIKPVNEEATDNEL